MSTFSSQIRQSDSESPNLTSLSAHACLSPAGTAVAASQGKWIPYKLHAFFNRLAFELIYGDVNRLILIIPPQHGKSEFWSRYFTSWYLGNHPDDRVALITYGGDFAKSWGRKVRDLLDEYGAEFYGVKVRQDAHKADDFSLAGYEGGMICAGIDGQITGRRVNLMMIDDYIKNQAEAESPARRRFIWETFHSTLKSRLSEKAKVVITATRWDIEDLIGMIDRELVKKEKEHWTIVHLPEIAEEDEDIQIGDAHWSRLKGVNLVPQIFSQASSEAKRDSTLPFWWTTQNQGRPYRRGGGDVKVDWFKEVDREQVPAIVKWVRAWDLAASEDESGKQTASILLGKGVDGLVYLLDGSAEWWGPGVRDTNVVNQAKQDGIGTWVAVEREGGSGGKVQNYALDKQMPPGTVFINAAAKGSKQERCDAIASAAHRGEVRVVRGPWVEKFKGQIETFPKGLIDMVDAAAHGYIQLTMGDEAEVPDGSPATPQEATQIAAEAQQIFMPPSAIDGLPGRIF